MTSKDVIDRENDAEVKFRYVRNKFGKCPALEYSGSEGYCTKLIPCDQYSSDDFVSVKHPWEKVKKMYCKCKFVEKN
ncbi:MAG: hypothetical protein U9R08_05170 [Nanoarchaeota archaeon]|nr:hypothetical protein [Nanoarchaeota archaeon]